MKCLQCDSDNLTEGHDPNGQEIYICMDCYYETSSDAYHLEAANAEIERLKEDKISICQMGIKFLNADISNNENIRAYRDYLIKTMKGE
jgi:hypothetical protein